MKETRFISQNKEKWQEAEGLLAEESKDPSKLSNLFTQVVDDLSYSRTYYPNRSVKVYLNRIARDYFSVIYDNKKDRKGRFRMFWMDELPQVIIHCRVQLLISLAVFLLSMAIGVFSSVKDPEFASAILGPGYVEMTKENIQKGDPMAVYKRGHQVDMFLGITFNNLLVAFRIYVFGIFLSIGTLAMLLSNGIMVGCFQFFFIERGLFLESALTIWLHGTLEISSLVLAGGAGLTLGSGLVFPGTYSRFQAFHLSAIRSLKLMLGITPVFVVAAIIESFLTRYTDVPDLVRLLMILLSLIFIIGYFVVYPWMKSRVGFESPLSEVKLPPTNNEKVAINEVKNNADLIKDAFTFYGSHFSRILAVVAVVSLAATILDMNITTRSQELRISYALWWESMWGHLFYAMGTPDLLFVGLNALMTSVVVYSVFRLIELENNVKVRRFDPGVFVQTFALVGVVYLLLFWLGGWGALILVFAFLFILLAVFMLFAERANALSAVSRMATLVQENFGQVMGLQLTLFLLSFSFLLVLSAPLIYIYTDILTWNFAESDIWVQRIVNFIELFVKFMAFNLIIPIATAGCAYLYFSMKERLSAGNLKQRIASVAGKYMKTHRA